MKFNIIKIIFIGLLLSDSIEIDATSYEDWIYINFATGGEIDASYADTPGWDIACQRYHFRTNSGLSGNGFGGAYVDSVSTWTSGSYASLIEVPEFSFFEKDTVVNTFYNVVDTDGDGVDEHIFGLPGIANPSLETWGWIDINNNYTMNYTDNQFIVRSGTGDRFYKVWAVNYYNDNGTSGYIKIYFDEISECYLGHDDCGECNGDNSSCSGCTDELACNYDVMARIDQDCEYPLDNYNCDGLCVGIDSDDDGICDDDDICPNNWDPYQNDRDQDGLADACDDDDDDGDGLIDCWGFWYDPNDGDVDGDGLADTFGVDCEDTALGFENTLDQIEFTLSQNFPNPFNPSTLVTYTISKPSNVTLNIFDINGKEVFTLDKGFRKSGNYTFRWDAVTSLNQRVSSGVYFYKLFLNGIEVDSKKMTLLY